MAYAAQIKPLIADSIDPRHVEAWMRCEHGTLDALSRSAFETAVADSVALIAAGGHQMSEMLAKSYGL